MNTAVNNSTENYTYVCPVCDEQCGFFHDGVGLLCVQCHTPAVLIRGYVRPGSEQVEPIVPYGLTRQLEELDTLYAMESGGSK